MSGPGFDSGSRLAVVLGGVWEWLDRFTGGGGGA
jgi:hypothetical protein